MSPLILSLVTILGALGALCLIGLFLLFRHGERAAAWVKALFRRPAKPGEPPGPGHYYKPYWS